MKKLTILGLTAALLCSLSAASLAAAELGIKAPELDVTKFVQGDPVKLADGLGKKAYVVEFWATWCGPCRTSIPHLTELQEKFKDDVTFIGISDEDEKTVMPFLKEMGDKMGYTVAVDTDRSTHADYMTAFGQNGIPTAFVVDQDGRIVWVGHPMADLEQVLDKVVAGEFDMEAHKAEQARAAAVEQNMVAYFEAAAKGEPSATEKAKGVEFVESTENPAFLNQFSWIILTHSQISYRDTELALKAAKKAYDLTEGKNADITDTYARALFDSGNKEEAIKFQQEAVNVATDAAMKSQLQSTLDRYEAAK